MSLGLSCQELPCFLVRDGFGATLLTSAQTGIYNNIVYCLCVLCSLCSLFLCSPQEKKKITRLLEIHVMTFKIMEEKLKGVFFPSSRGEREFQKYSLCWRMVKP